MTETSNEPEDDYLEKALSAAFAVADGKVSVSGRSRGSGAGTAKKIPAIIGRYPIEGVVGRGGIGLVLRARDTEIGRTIALKILHEHLAGDKEIVRRFTEEAQIGGNLEHPGVVPIHEMGIADDGRPFFTMKLVEGDTLAKRLDARRSPDDERLWFVSTFEKVCQIVAFAHERNVVHLDLKPANILVGAFGEIQITDWGFAASIAGATIAAGDGSAASVPQKRVVGTPSYMAPEQARGETQKLDARTDVFALGAILAEIISGKPAYEGEVASELLLAASRGWLEGTHKRIAASGADQDLIALASRCLAERAGDRPENAGEVADAMGRYLRSLDERARRAAIDAAEARERAAADRRQKRLLLTLAAVVVGAVVVYASSWMANEKQKAARTREDDRLVIEMAERVRSLVERARAAKTPAPALWEEPYSTAKRATEIAETRGVDEELRRRVAALARDVDHGRAEAITNDRTLHELTAIHERFGDAREAAQKNRDFEAAFRGAGIDMAALDIEAAKTLIKAHPIRTHLLTALDDWIAVHRSTATVPGEKLVAVADAIDEDKWRIRVRNAAVRRDVPALEALANAPGIETESPDGLVLLASYLKRLQKGDLAQKVLEAAVRREPGHYAAHHELATILRDRTPAQLDLAIREFSMALAIRPHSAHAIVDLGQVYLQSGASETAERYMLDAQREDARYAPAYHYLGAIYAFRRQVDRAEPVLRRGLELDPGSSQGYAILGLVLSDSYRKKEAADALREAMRHEPVFTPATSMLATVLISIGEFEEALKVVETAIEDPKTGAGPSMAQLDFIARELKGLIAAAAALPKPGETAPKPASIEETLTMARAAWFKGRLRDAARLIDDFLEEASESMQLDPSVFAMAAEIAARAALACAESPVPPYNAAEWRATAREWIVGTINAVPTSGLSSGNARELAKLLDLLRQNPAFDTMRGATAIADLPEAERDRWLETWQRVDETIKKLDETR